MIDQNYFSSTNIIGDFNDSTIDNSGYGSLSAAEKNQTYFAYFSSVGGTGPEIIDQTAYFIKYLIDAQGDVVAPQPNSIDILNMLQNFEAGRIVNVTSLEGTTLFTTLLGTKQTTGVGRIQPILITETGSGRTDYVTTMSFSSGPGGVGLDSAYNYAFSATKALSAFISNTLFATLDFGNVSSNSGSNYNNSTYIYTFPNDTTSQGTQVSFKTTIVAKSAFSGPNQNNRSNYLRFQIQRSTDGGISYPPLELTDGVYTRLQYFNNSDEIKSSTAQTKPINFNAGDRIRVQYSVDSEGVENQLRILAADNNASTLFTNTQTYIADNFITSPYWTIGTYTTSSNDFTVITASLGLTGLNQSQYTQVTPAASTAFNFSNITLPFTPQPGDFIRFEYNPNNVHIIYENLITTDGNLALKVVPSIPSGSILDHFCMYRINPNAGNQIILNVPKPAGTTGQPLTGFIKPQYMSKELEDNFTTIVQKLAAEGLLT
jgi:hypothetical protein